MIKEYYISFEIAKLLKEKGFNPQPDNNAWLCIMYDEDGGIHWGMYDPNWYFRITHQLVLQWLREVHKLHIAIVWNCGAFIGKNSFCYLIKRMDNYEDNGYNKFGFDSYEDAVEAAIKYSLKHLI